MEVYGKDLMAFMDSWAPQSLAEPWDHPGLQAGNPDKPVRKVMAALDVTKAGTAYAAAHHVDMIISHHPFLFKGMKTVDLRTEKGQILAELLGHGILAFAAHTNLDTAEGGVNDTLAAAIGLSHCEGLVPVREEEMEKIVVYVPSSHAAAVRKAMEEAGAGVIGAYRGCSFSAGGTGRFIPEEEAHPFLGTAGKEEEAPEERIETCCLAGDRERILAAVRKAHPYEEPVCDVYALKQGSRWDRMGRIGLLEKEMDPWDAARYIQKKLGIPQVKLAGPVDHPVRKVAVLGGAGTQFAPLAKKAGADLYLTGDVKYHEAQDAAALGLLVMDGGHFYTERVIIPEIARRLRETAEKEHWDLEVLEDPTASDVFMYR